MSSPYLFQVPGLTDGFVVEANLSEGIVVTHSQRRSRCIDCEQVIRVNDSEDKFWPWIAQDGSVRCEAQDFKWGHRVASEVAEWLDGSRDIDPRGL
jgi:hypothetical protein